MGKGLGIAALVILVISFPIPFLGTWIGYLALVLAAAAALFNGGNSWAIATTIIAAVKMYALSPGLMTTMYVPVEGYPVSPFFLLTTFFAVLPIAMLVFRPAMRGLLSKLGILKSVDPVSPQNLES